MADRFSLMMQLVTMLLLQFCTTLREAAGSYEGGYFRQVSFEKPDQIKPGFYWVVCLSGVGLRVGTPAVGGLGTVTHLNERDIMKGKGRVCDRETNSVLFSPWRNIFSIFSPAPCTE